MIDTVRANLPGFTLRSELRDTPPPGWQRIRRTYERDCVNVDETIYSHADTGARIADESRRFVDRDGEVLMSTRTWVEASLPRVRYGSNGVLLRSQEEVDASLRALDGLISEFEEPLSTVGPGLKLIPGPPRQHPVPYDFTRVDAVWHVQTPTGCGPFLRAHAALKHPRLRKGAPTHYAGQTLTFQGVDGVLRLYDKRQEQEGKTGDILRIEFQARRKLLCPMLGPERQVLGGRARSIDALGAYRQLASFAHDLGAVRVPPRHYALKHYFLQKLIEEEPDAASLLMMLPERTRRRYRAEAKAFLQREWIHWNWREALPASHMPAALDVTAAAA